MLKKILIILFWLINYTNLYAKDINMNNFNQKYLSNYFSALVSTNNQDNDLAIKYFNSSKTLLLEHENFLKQYVFSLVEDNQIKKSIQEINKQKNKNTSNFFEAKVLLMVNEVKKKNYLTAKKYSDELFNYEDNRTFEVVIAEILRSYIDLFLERKFVPIKSDFGKLNLITQSFQQCYLNKSKSLKYYEKLINSEREDYSRYLFFYFLNLIENNRYNEINELSNKINILDSNLLILQSRDWINNKEFFKFKNIFSCENPNHLLSEFFFLVANLYSSEKKLKKSNFYLLISNYLNPKFIYNNTLLAENYFINENYNKANNILNKFQKRDKYYNWYKIKKLAQIISFKNDEDKSLLFLEKKLLDLDDPSVKVLYDMANIYKNFDKFNKAIEFYDLVLLRIDSNSLSYAEVLYRKGGSFERLGDYFNADRDLLKSIEINPDDAYVLNYLAYSWLERNLKTDLAIKMLIKAHNLKEDDPYIADSLGWAFYLNKDYKKAEEYLNLAIQLKPYDPVIMDHYADTLWMLGRKIQAKYLWNNIMKIENTSDVDKVKVKKKILTGLNNI